MPDDLVLSPGEDCQLEQPEVHLVATNPQEMATSQHGLLKWLTSKVREVRNEVSDLKHAHAVAVQNKWAAATLKRQVERASERLTFYRKAESAVEAGFTLIPNFPIDVFAVRVKRAKPRQVVQETTGSGYSDPAINIPDQQSQSLELGDGRYVSPSQLVHRRKFEDTNDKGEKVIVRRAWPTAFGDIVFPMAAARPEVMGAAAQAMALKVFDEVGICPQSRKGDPLIIGTIKGKKIGWSDPKTISFLIAWHLDLRTL